MRLVAIAAALSAGCFVAPPSRTTTSVMIEPAENGARVGSRITTGAHSASFATKADSDIDLGAGYIYERLDPDPEAAGDHGTYISLSAPVLRRGKTRLWLGGQAEVFWSERSERSPRRGLSARLALDRFVVGGRGGSSSRGTAVGFYGSLAMELFTEVGVRTNASSQVAGVFILGVSLRAPLLGGVSSGGPGIGLR